MNAIQVELLRRFREGDDDARLPLMRSIAGIALPCETRVTSQLRDRDAFFRFGAFGALCFGLDSSDLFLRANESELSNGTGPLGEEPGGAG